MLREFSRIRRHGSDALQHAAIRSTEWYEKVTDKLHLDPISFAYDYLRGVAGSLTRTFNSATHIGRQVRNVASAR
jgi:hypothetical protein